MPPRKVKNDQAVNGKTATKKTTSKAVKGGKASEESKDSEEEMDTEDHNGKATKKEENAAGEKDAGRRPRQGRAGPTVKRTRTAEEDNAPTGKETPTETSEEEPRKRKVPRGRKPLTLVEAAPLKLEVPHIEGKTKVLAAGDGEVGQLGIGEDGENGKTRFVPVNSLETDNDEDSQPSAVRCAAGAMHSLVLTSEGKLYSFGCNDDGALGRKTAEEIDCFTPGRVDLPADVKISKIAVGNVHNVALTTDGRVLLWGIYRDSNGPLGIDPKEDKAEPIRQPQDISPLLPERIVDVSCGADHTLMLGSSGRLYSMGCAEQGRLGRIRSSHCCRENRRAKESMLAPGLANVLYRRKAVKFDRIWAGRYTTFARSSDDGAIWGCGLNNFSQLGSVKSSDLQDHCAFSLVKLTAFDPTIRWKEIAGGEQHTLALDEDGNVYAMGRVLYGRLGLGELPADAPDFSTLQKVKGLEKITAIAAGDHTSFALSEDGTLYSWGQGTNMLGQGDRESADEQDLFVPTVCVSKTLKISKVANVSAGSNHALCIVAPKDSEK